MNLRFELSKPFGGLKTETLNELEQIVIAYSKEYHALQLLQADVVGQSEQLPCPECGQLKPCAYNSPETCFHPEVC